MPKKIDLKMEEIEMTVLINTKLNLDENGEQDKAIHTTLYDLIDAVNSSTGTNENHLTCCIVSYILQSNNVQLSKRLVENVE